MTDIKPDLVITDLPSPAPDNPLEALSWLGDTVEEVVEGLRARGIKGRLKNTETCPLASYLNLWWKDVGVGRSIFHADNWPQGDLMPASDLPKVFGEFVDGFDCGRYPDLIDSDG